MLKPSSSCLVVSVLACLILLFWGANNDFHVDASESARFDVRSAVHTAGSPTPFPTPSFSINDVETVEGNGFDQAELNFLITRSISLAQTSSVVTFSTADVSAVAPGDYSAIVNETVTFAPDETVKEVTVLINPDTMPETDETLTFTISNVSYGTISRPTGTGTILNDDPGIPGTGIEGDIVDGTGSPFADGLVLANDVSTIRQFILGTAVPSNATNQFQRADVNLPCGNGRLDAGDVTVIRQIVLGTIPNNTFGCGPVNPASIPRIVSSAFLDFAEK